MKNIGVLALFLGVLGLLPEVALAKAENKANPVAIGNPSAATQPGATKPVSQAKGDPVKGEKGLWDISIKTIDGQSTKPSTYQGKVLLIVNTASECGFTPQYAGLEKIYQEYQKKNFLVLGFPSNDFGGQEPGTEAEIKKFCELKYKTTFPMFAKVGVKQNPHPLYQYLQNQAKAEVGWNFGKFLVKKDGSLQYFSSKVTPESKELTSAIEAALKE